MLVNIDINGYRPALRFLCLLYYVISISYRVCFLGGNFDPYKLSSDEFSSLPVVVFDALSDLFFIVDTFVQLLEECSRGSTAEVSASSGTEALPAALVPVQSDPQRGQRRSLQIAGRRSVSEKSIFVKGPSWKSPTAAGRGAGARRWWWPFATLSVFSSAVHPSPDSSAAGRTASTAGGAPGAGSHDRSEGTTIKRSSMRILAAARRLSVQQGDNITPIHASEYLVAIALNACSLLWQLLLLFPMETVAYCAGMRYRFYWLRSFRLFRCYYIFLYWKQIRVFVLEQGVFQVQPSGMQRILLLTALMALIGHLAACLFYALAYNQMQENGFQRTWLSADGIAEYRDGTVVLLRSIPYIYLRSLYWSIQTVTNVAFGDVVAFTEAETWFCIFYFYLAALLVYVSIANFILVITNLDSARTENLVRIAKFERYAAYRKLPAEMINRVVSYYEYQWERLRGVDEQQVLILYTGTDADEPAL